jgi:AcrR family transcriptional regulator
VVDAALAVVDEQGPAALTLAAVAARTGVATPSLYKHVAGLPELRRLLAVRLFDELADVLRAAAVGRSGDDALTALAAAYHRQAVARPHRYALMPQVPDPDPAVAAAGERVVGVFFAVLKGAGFGDEDQVHATRVLRAALHGFAVLSTGGGFGRPEDLTVTHQRLVATLLDGLRAWPR